MTNDTTEAVRRLRQLQEDVERLKSGGNQGQVRELRRVDGGVVAADAANSRLNDAETTDSVSSNDSATVSNLQTASPAVCDIDNADKSDAG